METNPGKLKKNADKCMEKGNEKWKCMDNLLKNMKIMRTYGNLCKIYGNYVNVLKFM